MSTHQQLTSESITLISNAISNIKDVLVDQSDINKSQGKMNDIILGELAAIKLRLAALEAKENK
jgi:hypothetical protein